jgi:single-stranded-DNA-specific exonuclease
MRFPSPASAAAVALARALDVSITMADLLLQRGLDAGTAPGFLAPKLAGLTSPEKMAGRKEAAVRLARAARAGEHVVVFGDYDCDGITATAILTEALRALGARVTPLLASRFGGGYGLSDQALERVLAQAPSLLVTCDCGSADGPRVARARAAGVDVIVIDHHLVPDEPLPALAFLNPHRPECDFPYKGLASCGLAMSVAAAVRSELGATLDVKTYLDLVAIGTIADVAPLDGDNRALVRAGLEAIRQGQRPGLKALADRANLDLSRPLGARDISFSLAPRLNAPGRLGTPDLALALLLARDPGEARDRAAECERLNEERQVIQTRMVDEANDRLRGLGDEAAIVVASASWHHGVVGIVAGRLASTHQRPAIVGAIDPEGVATGSVRTARNINIHEALGRCGDVLLGFGGHAKAAGVTFRAERAADLARAFARACADLTPPEGEQGPQADPEVFLDRSDDFGRVATDLQRLEPCGEGNPSPRLCLPGARVRSAREVRGGHLSMEFDFAGRPLRAFGLQLGHLAGSLPAGQEVQLVGQIQLDYYRGGGAVELRLDTLERA